MASVTVQKHTLQSACAGQVGHIYRLHDSHSNEEIRPELAHLNQLDGQSAGAAQRAIREILAEIDERTPPQRVRADRKTVASLVVPAPREGLSHEECGRFFSGVLEELKAAGYHVACWGVHADEIHSYLDPSDQQVHQSREHLHVLLVPEVPDKGCNMKAWLTKQRFRDLNSLCDRVCERELGYSFQDGSQKRSRGSVERVKALSTVEAIRQEPERRAKLQELERRIRAATQATLGAKGLAAVSFEERVVREPGFRGLLKSLMSPETARFLTPEGEEAVRVAQGAVVDAQGLQKQLREVSNAGEKLQRELEHYQQRSAELEVYQQVLGALWNCETVEDLRAIEQVAAYDKTVQRGETAAMLAADLLQQLAPLLEEGKRERQRQRGRQREDDLCR